jgi:uncharacterized protein (DUF1501 family)
MQRRDFLRMASAAGVGIPSWALLPAAQAQTSGPYTGRILINVHASGGIDQSSWADPRETDSTMNNYAGVTPAGVAGNIRFAPMGNNASFFTKYNRQMLVINGVHSETNGHDEGTQAHATGTLAMGYPNIAELFAAKYGKGMPMAWLNAGGFRNSVGLVPPTPVPDTNAWRALTQPNAQSATNDYMKQADLTRAQMVRAERMKAMQARGDLLPRSQNTVEQFVGAADSRALLQRVSQYTPATFDAFTQAHVGLIAAQAGITSTIQLSSGGFDGHNQLANGYANALPRLTDMVDYIWQKSADLGLSNRIFLRIYSEFGRTPLNNGNGKDHWAIGTQILMEAAPAWGNRVFGASGPRHEGLMINTATGAVDAAAGKLIRPRHIHTALRKYLGSETTDARFNLKVPADEMFDFFNPAANTGYPNL